MSVLECEHVRAMSAVRFPFRNADDGFVYVVGVEERGSIEEFGLAWGPSPEPSKLWVVVVIRYIGDDYSTASIPLLAVASDGLGDPRAPRSVFSPVGERMDRRSVHYAAVMRAAIVAVS